MSDRWPYWVAVFENGRFIEDSANWISDASKFSFLHDPGSWETLYSSELMLLQRRKENAKDLWVCLHYSLIEGADPTAGLA
jgi:hypothetical protein